MINYYQELNLDRSMSCEELRREINRQRRKYQMSSQNAPDYETQQQAEKILDTLREAVDVLTDAEKRAAYDLKLDGIASAIAKPGADGPAVLAGAKARLLALIEQQVMSGDPQRALRNLRESPVYSAQPDDPYVRITEARCLAASGQLSEARNLYQQVRDGDLSGADADLLSKIALLDLQYLNDAHTPLQLTTEMLERWPNHAALHEAYCLQAIRRNAPEEAETMLKRFLHLNTSLAAKVMAGEIYAKIALTHAEGYDEDKGVYYYPSKESANEFGRLVRQASELTHSPEITGLEEAYRRGQKLSFSPIGVCLVISTLVYWLILMMMPGLASIASILMTFSFLSVPFQFVPSWISARQRRRKFRPGPFAFIDVLGAAWSFPFYAMRIMRR